MPKAASDRFQDIRDAVRSLCAAFPDEYHRDIDARRTSSQSTSSVVPPRGLTASATAAVARPSKAP